MKTAVVSFQYCNSDSNRTKTGETTCDQIISGVIPFLGQEKIIPIQPYL